MMAVKECMETRIIEKILKILQENNLISIEEQIEAEKILHMWNL